MADRNTYTYTPGYAGSGRGYVPPGNRKPTAENARAPRAQAPQIEMQYEQEGPPPPRRNLQPQQPQYPTRDLIMFALVLFAVPLVGIVGVFFRPFLWVFILLNAGCLAALWLMRLFAKGTRVAFSVILLALAVLALVAAIDLTPKQTDYPLVSGTDLIETGGTGTDPSLGTFPSIADPQQQQNSGTPDWQSLNQGGGDGTGGDTGGSDGGAGLTPTGVPVLGGDPGTEATSPPANQAVVQAKEALESYLRAWTTFDYDEMTKHTLPSWRQVQDSAKQQLYMMHNWWQVNNWTITNETTSPSADSVTFYVVVDMQPINAQKSAVKQQFTALVIKYEGDGLWYVDPDSMRTGITVEETPPPQQLQEAGETPEPTASPEPTVGPNTTLWYNTKGGKRYHIDEHCKSLNPDDYDIVMKSFPYSDLGKSAYSKLVPCETCNAPERE